MQLTKMEALRASILVENAVTKLELVQSIIRYNSDDFGALFDLPQHIHANDFQEEDKSKLLLDFNIAEAIPERVELQKIENRIKSHPTQYQETSFATEIFRIIEDIKNKVETKLDAEESKNKHLEEIGLLKLCLQNYVADLQGTGSYEPVALKILLQEDMEEVFQQVLQDNQNYAELLNALRTELGAEKTAKNKNEAIFQNEIVGLKLSCEAYRNNFLKESHFEKKRNEATEQLNEKSNYSLLLDLNKKILQEKNFFKQEKSASQLASASLNKVLQESQAKIKAVEFAIITKVEEHANIFDFKEKTKERSLALIHTLENRLLAEEQVKLESSNIQEIDKLNKDVVDKEENIPSASQRTKSVKKSTKKKDIPLKGSSSSKAATITLKKK